MSEGTIWLVDGSTLFAVDLRGEARRVRRGCEEVSALAPFGEGDVVLWDSRVLTYVWGADGASQVISREWAEGGRLLGCPGERVVAVERGVMLEVAPDGAYTPRVQSLSGAELMTTWGERIFLVARDILWEIDPATWSRREVHRELGGVAAVACARGGVYAVQRDGNLYKIDPETGGYASVPGEWPGVFAMAGGGDVLVALAGDTLYAVEDSGEHRVIAREWENVKAMASVLGA